MKHSALQLLISLLICHTCSAAQLYPIMQQGMQGYIDASGKVVIEPKYAEVGKFSEEMAAVKPAADGKWGYIDSTGNLTIPAQFDMAREFSQGFAAVRSGNKWQFIDKTGKIADSAKFDHAYSFSDGLALVKVGGKYEFVDRNIKKAFPTRFEGAWPFNEGLAPVKLKDKWGFIDTTGKIIIKPVYYWVDNFSEGLAYVEGGKLGAGYIDRTGRFVIKRRFLAPNPFTEGVAAVVPYPEGGLILINEKGDKVADLPFFSVGIFSNGRAVAREEGGCRYIDPAGKVLGEKLFSYARSYSGELAKAYVDGKPAYINMDEQVVWGPCDPGTPAKSAEQSAANTQKTYPTAPPPKEIQCIGNPQLKRYPDGGKAVYSRGVWDMALYEGRIYTGGGDLVDNTGPTDVYSFAPGEEEFTLEYSAEEEQVTRFYVFDGKLALPGEDPRESWDFGNIYIKEAGKWRKVRTLPRGLHCFPMAYLKGTLYAVISTDFPCNQLLASRDWGQSWTKIAHYSPYIDTLFALGGKLKAYASPGNLCTLKDGLLVPSNMVPRFREMNNLPNDEFEYIYFERAAPAVTYRDGVLLTQQHYYDAPGDSKPTPLYYLKPDDAAPRVVSIPDGESAMDVVVRGKRVYALCSHRGKKGFDNTIYTSRDLKTWQPVVRFTTEAFAASMEEWKGIFYVGLAANRGMSDPLPKSTGDILRVVPSK